MDSNFLAETQTAEMTVEQVYQAVRYKLNEPVTDAVQEIADYLKISTDEVQKNFKIGELARDDWNKLPSTSKEHVEDYYRKTFGYIYDLMAAFYVYREGNVGIINNLIKFLRIWQPKSVLDFGAGAAWYPILLKRLGVNVTCADLEGETMRFAQWRFAQRNLDIPFKVADQWDQLGTYDFIYAFSVMEHAYDPVGLMRQIKNHLAPRGLVYLQNDFFASEPMHLEKNLIYQKTFATEMEALGFTILRNIDNALMVMTVNS